jgi:hypothetical protein
VSVLAAQVAAGQWGAIGVEQLRACGVTRSTVSRWRADGKLHPILPAVYALGHPWVPIEGQLVAALIHAGRDAVLSHGTAAWWWGLVEEPPGRIEVSSLSRARSVPQVLVHHPHRLNSTRHRRLPITTVARTLLDFAKTSADDRVRRALAEADYRKLLDPREVRALLGRGRAGSTTLARALSVHEPRLALTRSRLERAFLALCESAGIPLPEVNPIVAGMMVDALWRPQRLVVELDGYDGHSSRAQIAHDRSRELRLRRAGFLVVRYTWDQITTEAELVVADLRANLIARP